MSDQFRKAQADQDALSKFKDAARAAKALIEDAVRKLRARNPGDVDAQDAERAKAQMDAEVRRLGDAMAASQDGGVEPPAAGTPSADGASPALDILA